MHMNNPKFIFLVEDDVLLSEIYTNCLNSLDNFKVLHFKSGEEMFYFMENIQPYVIITDYNLSPKNPSSHMDGLELIRKSKLIFENVPIAMITGEGSESMDEALEDGADFFIEKDENSVSKLYKWVNEL